MSNHDSFRHGSKISTQEKIPIKFFNGYCYVFSKKVKFTLYVVCVKRRDCCKGSGKIIHGQFYALSKHNHPPNHSSESIYQFEEELRCRVIADPWTSLKFIYDEISLIYPQVAIHKTWVNMEYRMRHWRKEIQPPRPATLTKYQEILNEPQWKFLVENSQNNETMYVSTIECGDGSHFTVFGNTTLLRSIQTSHLMMDATFKVVPKTPIAQQLFVILAFVNNIAIPIMWSLMERKTAVAYTKLLQHFSTVLAPQIDPETITSDFEASLALAININYPRASHRRCLFHYVQALMKKLKSLRLLPFLQQCSLGRVIVKKFLSLPLLPAENIKEAFDWLKRNIPQCMTAIFQEFLAYYNRQWIRRLRPERLSVFGMIHRTNNFCESYNRVLQQKLGVHPQIWQFTAHLNKMQQNALLEYRSVVMGNITRRKMRMENVIYNEKLLKLWNIFQLGLITIPQFLACASNDLKSFANLQMDELESSIQLISYDNTVYNLEDYRHLEIFQEIDLYKMIFIIP